jgi:hypothetical protein
MIDAATGEIALSTGERIGPTLTPEASLRLPLATHPRSPDGASPIGELSNGKRFHVGLHFQGQRLANITLALSDAAYGTSWDDASEEKERARKAAHETLITADLGAPTMSEAPVPGMLELTTWSRPWGKIESIYDARTGGSEVRVSYVDET